MSLGPGGQEWDCMFDLRHQVVVSARRFFFFFFKKEDLPLCGVCSVHLWRANNAHAIRTPDHRPALQGGRFVSGEIDEPFPGAQ